MGILKSVLAPALHVELSEKTGFSLEQIGILHKRFKQLSNNENTLRREHFSVIEDLSWNPIRTEIIEAFFDSRNFNRNTYGMVPSIGFEEFLVVLSHFKPPSARMTEDELEYIRIKKLKFLFNMHDPDNDGVITIREYRHVLEDMLSRSGAIGKEAARYIADSAMLEVASITMGHMEPDEFYEGITFTHFVKLLNGFSLESRMSVRFLNVKTPFLCK